MPKRQFPICPGDSPRAANAPAKGDDPPTASPLAVSVRYSHDAIPVAADGQPQLHWREETLLKALDISHTFLWQRISAGAFPRPMKLPDDRGGKVTGKGNRWDVRLLLEWLNAGMPHFDTWQSAKKAQG